MGRGDNSGVKMEKPLEQKKFKYVKANYKGSERKQTKLAKS